MRNIAGISLLLILITLISGCVYPSKRTYYEVASTDGRLHPSSCVYPSGRKDSIVRPLDNAELYVTTKFTEAHKVEVALQVSSRSNNVEINAKEIYLISEQPQKQVSPESIAPSSYNSGNSNDKFPVKNWVHLSYPVQTNDVAEFSLSFGRSAIIIEGNKIQVNPINFKKVTKSGIYLLTINC